MCWRLGAQEVLLGGGRNIKNQILVELLGYWGYALKKYWVAVFPHFLILPGNEVSEFWLQLMLSTVVTQSLARTPKFNRSNLSQTRFFSLQNLMILGVFCTHGKLINTESSWSKLFGKVADR